MKEALALAAAISQGIDKFIEAGHARFKSDVARALEVSPASITDWERTGKISKEHFWSLATLLKDTVPPSHWFDCPEQAGVFRDVVQFNSQLSSDPETHAAQAGPMADDSELSVSNRELALLLLSVPNRAAFARKWAIPGGGSMVYQHIRGLKPVSLESALIYSEAFKAPLKVICPTLARKYPSLADTVGGKFQPIDTEVASENSNEWTRLSSEFEGLSNGGQLVVINTLKSLIAALVDHRR